MKKLLLAITILSINSFCLINAMQKGKRLPLRKPTVNTKATTKPSQKGTCNFYAFKSQDGTKSYFVTECNIK